MHAVGHTIQNILLGEEGWLLHESAELCAGYLKFEDGDVEGGVVVDEKSGSGSDDDDVEEKDAVVEDESGGGGGAQEESVSDDYAIHDNNFIIVETSAVVSRTRTLCKSILSLVLEHQAKEEGKKEQKDGKHVCAAWQECLLLHLRLLGPLIEMLCPNDKNNKKKKIQWSQHL